MIPQKFSPYVFSFYMSLLMSCIMSFVITLFNVGLVEGILWIWLQAWGFAWLVALPTVTLVVPVVRRLVVLSCRQEAP